MLNLEIILGEQEEDSPTAKFDKEINFTMEIMRSFGDLITPVITATLEKIINERVNTERGADYLQSVTIGETHFWVIDDGISVTFLFPEEY